jgi:hypothetical protein
MYRKHHNGQLSIEDFHVPCGGTFDPVNRIQSAAWPGCQGCTVTVSDAPLTDRRDGSLDLFAGVAAVIGSA